MFGTRQREFRTACSAAGPELGDYTQWVRWRAPIEKNKNQEGEETYSDGLPRGQVRSGAGVKGVAFGPQLRLDFQEQLI